MIIGVDYATNSSSPTLTRIGHDGTNATYGGPTSGGSAFNSFGAWGGIQRCNVWSDGTVTTVYGNRCYTDTDTADMGSVMVQVPAFLYYVDTSYTNHVKYYIAALSDAGSAITTSGSTHTLSLTTDIHPAFQVVTSLGVTTRVANTYVGAYEGYVNNGVLDSIAGQTTTSAGTSGWSVGQYRAWAEARGTGWELSTIQQMGMLKLLYMVEYASLNSQSSVGIGADYTYVATSGYTAMGGTAPSGNSSYGTQGNTSGTQTPMSYRGVENLWANYAKIVEGVNIKPTTMEVWIAPQTRLHTYAGATYGTPYVDTGAQHLTTGGDFIGAVDNAGAPWAFTPTTGGGNSTTYFCDATVTPQNTADQGLCTLYAFSGGAGGIFGTYPVWYNTYAPYIIGRLCYLPSA